MSTSIGTLYYLIGPSGAGKDSILAAVKRHLTPNAPVAVARRTITRPDDATGENHVPMDWAGFREREAQGGFALTWESHGCLYGIGREVDDWLTRGIRVLVNGSRGALGRAEAHWGDALIPVVVRVDADILEQRLQQRGREDADAIRRRLDRARTLGEPDHPRRMIIDNNGPLDLAAGHLADRVAGRRSECS